MKNANNQLRKPSQEHRKNHIDTEQQARARLQKKNPISLKTPPEAIKEKVHKTVQIALWDLKL